MKFIVVLIAVEWIIASVQSKDYDIKNVYNVSNLSFKLSEPLNHLIAEKIIAGHENAKNVSNFGHLNGRAKTNTKEYNWETLQTWKTTKMFMSSMISKYSDVVTAQIGGSTFEKRLILGIKISYKGGNKGIFIEAGIHGRDWITSSAATYMISQLVDPPNETVRSLAESFDWYIFPSINPDGFVYSNSYKYNHYWKKNRLKVDGEPCRGVDLDRNWGFHWGEDEEELGICDQDYAGTHAFSEIETSSFSKYLTSLGLEERIHFYISLHSYGQEILYPYGYTSKLPQNVEIYRQIVQAAQKGFSSRYKTEYKGGPIYNTLYPISGSSIDWVYGNGICELAFNIQLRPPISSSERFVIDEKEIFPICEETLDGILSMINKAINLGVL